MWRSSVSWTAGQIICPGCLTNGASWGILRYKKDILRHIFVPVLLKTIALVHQLLVLGLKTVRNILMLNSVWYH